MTRSNLKTRALALASAAVAAALLAAPAPAFARKAASDAVGGVPIGSDRARAAVAPDVDAAAAILVGPDGRVLWSRGAGARRPMASTTKMMTALLAIEAGGLDKTVTVSRAAAGVEYATGLRAGERVTKRKLLELALVASSNDAAYALGEGTAGSMPRFVARMNERARELGLRDTRFANPHGLDARGHFSSAADLATLARFAMNRPEFRRTVSIRSVTMPPAPGRTGVLKTTDDLLGRYPGMSGVKTGFTNGAGFSFVGMARRDGTVMTAVVLGTPSDAARFANTARLLDWGFAHAKRREISRPGVVGATAVASAPGTKIPVRVQEASSALLLDVDGPVRRRVSVPATIALPVFEGQRIGEVTVSQGRRVLTRLPAVATTSVASVDETVGAVPVGDFVDRTVPAVTAKSSGVPRFDVSKPVQRRVVLEPSVLAPVTKGDNVGWVVYTQGEKVVLRVPVTASAEVQAPDFLQKLRISLDRGWRSVTGAPVVASMQVTVP